VNSAQVKGKLLFCHGARATSWREPFDTLTATVKTQYPHPVVLAFLEFMQPDFATAVRALEAQGAQQIDVILLFLAAGGHTRNDVTALVDQARAQHPNLTFNVTDTLLESEQMRAATVAWISDQI
jgi:sirohydrochlorin cobaltochelatase